jgi:hypothetical protein
MEKTECTIVTCYYKIPSKHPYQQYDQWMIKFLTTVETPMVIYTDDQSIEKIKDLRKWAEDKTIIINKPLQFTYCAQEKYLNTWVKDWRRDLEGRIHNPKLYIIWNNKSKFVEEVIQANYFNTEYFCWCDIGCFRTQENLQKYKNFPKVEKIVATNTKDKMQILNIEQFNNSDIAYMNAIKEQNKLKENELTELKIENIFQTRATVGGTIFLGHKDTWNIWIPTFYNMMDTLIKNDTFAGKDQDIMAIISLLYPELVHLITPPTSNGWFYLQDYFI